MFFLCIIEEEELYIGAQIMHCPLHGYIWRLYHIFVLLLHLAICSTSRSDVLRLYIIALGYHTKYIDAHSSFHCMPHLALPYAPFFPNPIDVNFPRAFILPLLSISRPLRSHRILPKNLLLQHNRINASFQQSPDQRRFPFQ